MTEPAGTHYLRLFPLQSVVLFPGMDLPLVVFEQRYLQLTQECMDAHEPFGVLLLRQGMEAGDSEAAPFEVGTTADITSTQNSGDGRLHLQTVGRRRFKVRSLHNEQPYLAADVEYLADDPAEQVEAALLTDVHELAVRFVQKLLARRGAYVRDVPLPGEPNALSYSVARMFQGQARSQQRLLEAASAVERLESEKEMLRSATERLARELQRSGPFHNFGVN